MKYLKHTDTLDFFTVDKINAIMGKNKVKLAVQGNGRKWKLRQEKLSPCYTTRFSDILEVVI